MKKKEAVLLSITLTIGALAPIVTTLAEGSYTGFKNADGTETNEIKPEQTLYWYENGIRQGVYGDPMNIKDPNYDGYERGREIYDPKSDAWYWLDANNDGAIAVDKEVWIPYTNQEEPSTTNGKWVRYDKYGQMIKGWYATEEGAYYYDPITGEMLKGMHVINGKTYMFDPVTGLKYYVSYSNSPLVDAVVLSQYTDGQRTHTIDRITPHCVEGQVTAESLGAWFRNPNREASSNYGIDRDGRVGMYVEEKNNSWCSSSQFNDQRAITIECASDTWHPYAVRDVVFEKLVLLCTDICERNGKNKLIWFNDRNTSLAYEPKPGEMVITVHRWFKNKACPGDYLYGRMGELADRVTANLSQKDIKIR